MIRLEKLLREWIDQDLIGSEQAEKILEHEQSKPSHSWAFYGFSLLGVVVIVIGIVSLVASNWKGIPNTVKLGLNFVLLLGLGAGVFYAWDRKRQVLFEVLLVSLMLLCLASIGLVSQIFHTEGKLHHALLLWSVITAGLAAASKHTIAPFMWTTGFLFGVSATILDSAAFEFLFHKTALPVLMATPLFCAVLAIICRSVSGDGPQTNALRFWTVLAGLAALLVAEFHVLGRSAGGDVVGYLPGYAFALVTGVGIGMSRAHNNIQKRLLFITLFLYLIPFHLTMLRLEWEVIYAACTIGVLSSMAIFLASLRYRILFQVFLIAIGLRFLVLYFHALGGLATTGFGLIVSGATIIALVTFWHRQRKNITTWAEGLVS